MKKLLTLVFTALMAISLALPVLAQDAGSQDQSASQDQGAKPKKEKKAKKSKKSKKSDQKMEGGEAPKQ